MRSIKNIKERVTDFGNLRDAYFHARRNKRFRNEVLEFSANLEDNLHDLQKALRDQTYVPGPYKKKVIHDPVDHQRPWIGRCSTALVLLHAAGRPERPTGGER